MIHNILASSLSIAIIFAIYYMGGGDFERGFGLAATIVVATLYAVIIFLYKKE